MNSATRSKQVIQMLTIAWAAAMLALAPQAALARAPAQTVAEEAQVTQAVTTGEGAAQDAAATQESAGSYTPLGPDMIKGQPVSGEYGFQEQYTEDGQYALWMHDAILIPVGIAITLLVMFLLLYVIVRYNRRANPTPSKVTHNTAIEVIWTGVPIVILVLLAIPSINLLISQFESPPEDAVTIKAIGYQWYWGYEYPDNGGFEVVSNMLPEDEAKAKGLPQQLAVDNRMVVPANTPLRIQVTSKDVIHAFAVPSLWYKLDAVPGRLNEKMLTIEEPGIYYGQCSELCGIKHGYMPIAVEALPREEWEAWVLTQPGGTVGSDEDAAAGTEGEGAEEDAAGADASGDAAENNTDGEAESSDSAAQ